MRKSAAAVMDMIPADSIPVLNKKYLFHSRYEKVKSLLKEPSAKNVLMSMTQQMNANEMAELIKDWYQPNAFLLR